MHSIWLHKSSWQDSQLCFFRIGRTLVVLCCGLICKGFSVVLLLQYSNTVMLLWSLETHSWILPWCWTLYVCSGVRGFICLGVRAWWELCYWKQPIFLCIHFSVHPLLHHNTTADLLCWCWSVENAFSTPSLKASTQVFHSWNEANRASAELLYDRVKLAAPPLDALATSCIQTFLRL